jgi:hypothetical protein
VAFDAAGNLYGATLQGGGNNCSPMAACGTVFQLAPPSKQGDPWTETVLHIFQGKQYNDGEYPSGGVITDALGNIYGTSSFGGTGDCQLLGIPAGCGTVFELSPPPTKGGKWTYTILYSFPTVEQGYVPWGDLVFDNAGNLYGATYGGGKGTTCYAAYPHCGTVFKLSPPQTKGGKWTEKTLYSFRGGRTDGGNPNGGLVFDSKGAIYGTTHLGGFSCYYSKGAYGEGCGTVFKLQPPSRKGSAWRETILHRFGPRKSDGGIPKAGLIIDSKNNVYGTTAVTAFRMTPPGREHAAWNETILHPLRLHEWDPWGALTFDQEGNLYGTTNAGGDDYYGTAFRLRRPNRTGGKWILTVLHNFPGSPDGGEPAANLIFDKQGNLYGTTQFGGTGQSCQRGCGTVFEVSP